MAKILIVDDEEIARVTLADILRLEGHEIAIASNGDAAVSALQSQPFDLMVLDLKMPGKSGMEVLRAVVDTLPNLSIIVLTAYGTMDSAIQAIRYRVHDYILKPADPMQIVQSIERAIAQKGDPSLVRETSNRATQRVERLPGGATLSWDKRMIAWEGGSLSLTPTEAKLVRILFDRRNEMVTHSELVYLIQGYQIETEEAAKILRPVVSRLRQKLTAVPAWGDRIKNVRGAGYVLELP